MSERAADDGYDWIKQKLKDTNDKKSESLKAAYPQGFQLFAIVNQTLVPNPAPSDTTLVVDWNTGRVLEIAPDFIRIQIPDALVEGRGRLAGNVQVGPNKVGPWGTTLSVQGWRSHVEILETTPRYVIAVAGCTKSDS